MSDSNFVDAVRNNYLFSSLPQEIINEIVSSLEVLTFKLGEPILKKIMGKCIWIFVTRFSGPGEKY